MDTSSARDLDQTLELLLRSTSKREIGVERRFGTLTERMYVPLPDSACEKI